MKLSLLLLGPLLLLPFHAEFFEQRVLSIGRYIGPGILPGKDPHCLPVADAAHCETRPIPSVSAVARWRPTEIRSPTV
jgi:hypothetical protein